MPSITSSLPEQAWQMVLDQLRTDMPMGSFNTWVKPVRFVSFEKGIFSLGTGDPKTRDWLQSRMTMLIQRQLQGILNQAVQVRFVVIEPESDLADEEDQQCPDPDESNSPYREIILEILHESVRSVLVEPERVVKLPVYFLRWLPYVDAEVIFLVLALRQEYFLASSGRKHVAEKVAVRAEQICQWAGISRAQFFRLLQPGSEFGWFGKKSETDYEFDRYTGRTKKSPNKYTLNGIPITPGDAKDLKMYLLDHGITREPETALRNALVAQPGEIFQYPVSNQVFKPEKQLPKQLTVQGVIREVVGQKPTPEMISLMDQLSERLLMPNEFILISWYFLRHWLPKLGADASMLVLMLRNACFFNDATGEIRDEVWIEGGYPTLAQRLGLGNPRMISYWFPAAIERESHKEQLTSRSQKEVERRVHLQEWMGAFVQRLGHRAGNNGSFSWKFKVQRRDPLIPEHEQIYQQIGRMIAEAEQQGWLGELMTWVDGIVNDCPETHELRTKIVLRCSNDLDDCSETLRTHLNDCLKTLEIEEDDCFETLLKILKGFKDSYMDQDTSSARDSLSGFQNQELEKVVVDLTDGNDRWKLEKLLARAGGKQRPLLEKQEKDAVPFVSWLIQGVSNPRIQSPYSLAIARLIEKPQVGAGGAYDRLAELPPVRFISLLQRRLSLCNPSEKDWETALGNTNLDRIRLLLDLLTIPPDLMEVAEDR